MLTNLYGSETDRMVLEPVGADLLHIVFRHDPAGGAAKCAVERHEIGPRLVQDKAHRVGIDRDDLLHLLLQLCSLRSLEAEHDILGRERVAVMKLEPLAQLELVGQLIGAFAPGFGEGRGHALTRHRPHQRVVQRDQHPERREKTRLRFAGIEPGRRDRHVKRKFHLAFRLGLRHHRTEAADSRSPCQECGKGKFLPSSRHGCLLLPC